MRLLLDTQIWLWALAASGRLGRRTSQALTDSGNDVYLSAASSWEIAIKYTLGKLPLPAPPERYVPERIRLSGVTPLAIEHSHALAVATLPELHRDPFDRLLIAQAVAERMTLVTADSAMTAYDVPLLDATA